MTDLDAAIERAIEAVEAALRALAHEDDAIRIDAALRQFEPS